LKCLVDFVVKCFDLAWNYNSFCIKWLLFNCL